MLYIKAELLGVFRTDNMKGKIRVFMKGQILVSHVEGQCSVHTLLKYEEELHRLIGRFSGNRFAHMLFFDKWELHTPEAVPVIERIVCWCITQGMGHIAEVLEHNALKEYILKNSLPEKKGNLQNRQFSSEPEALVWLEQEGYVVDNKSLIMPK